MNRAAIVFLLCITFPHELSSRNLQKRSAGECKCDPSLACAPKYQTIPHHTACLPRASTAVPIALTAADKTAIVDQHNQLRFQVVPVATDMLTMHWDDEVAMLAQRWAEACDREQGTLHHDHVRDIPGRFSVGQNIGMGYKNFSEAIDAWFAEKDNYKPLFGTPVSSVGGPKPVGHYTQMVWASTNKIGCAVARCSGMAFHVCNYAPRGNYVPFKSPYTTGPQKCSECKNCQAGLCDCGGLTCENAGVLNVTSCQCECKYKEYHVGSSCQLSCNYQKDLQFCGTQKGFYKSDCGTSYASSACPKLCGLCPCADASLSPKPCGTSSKGKDSDSGSVAVRSTQVHCGIVFLVVLLLRRLALTNN